MGNWKFMNKPKNVRVGIMMARDQTRMVQKLLRDNPKMTNTEAVKRAKDEIQKKYFKRRRPKGTPRPVGWLLTPDEIDLFLPAMETLAKDRLLTFWAFVPDDKGRSNGQTTHIRLIYEGAEVLAWWPSTGTWFCRLDRRKGKTLDYVEVVDIACHKASRL